MSEMLSHLPLVFMMFCLLSYTLLTSSCRAFSTSLAHRLVRSEATTMYSCHSFLLLMAMISRTMPTTNSTICYLPVEWITTARCISAVDFVPVYTSLRLLVAVVVGLGLRTVVVVFICSPYERQVLVPIEETTQYSSSETAGRAEKRQTTRRLASDCYG